VRPLYDHCVPSPTTRADGYWAAVFQVDAAELRRPGLHSTFVEDASAGIYVLRLADTVRVRAPEGRRAVVDALIEESSLDGALDGAAWRKALAGSDALILGPATHYLASENVGRSNAAAIALNAAIRRAGIARWRCRVDNAASVALASGFGLQPYAHNLGIRL
jgi:hypothetical protein